MAESLHIARREDIGFIAEALADGDCCSIVGMSNIGKSHLLRSLRRADVRAEYLGTAADSYIIVYIDFNLMWELTDQGFYEVILRGIMSAVEHLATDEQTGRKVRDSYHALINPSSPFLIPVSFNEGLIALNPGWQRRLVLLFDEFDEAWANIDRRAFLNLRALRDRYQESLCFVTGSVKRLEQTRPGREIGEFCELFTHHTRHLAPLSATDSREFIQTFAMEEEIHFREDTIAFVQAQADGHPGLLEAACHALVRGGAGEPGLPGEVQPFSTNLADLLDSDDVIRTECAKLWNDLSEAEQVALIGLVTNGETLRSRELASLRRTKTVARLESQTRPFCRLFEGFVRRQALARQPERKGIRMDVESGDVWVDDLLLEPLTDLEYRLMLLLYGNIDKICDKYKIVESVWGESYIDQVDDARIEKLVSRLRSKLGEDPAKSRYLVTVRGRGYKLTSSAAS